MNWSREGPEAMRLIRRRWLSPLSLEFPCMHNDSSILLVFTARCPNIMSFHQLTPFRSTHVSKHWRHPDHFTSQVPVKSDPLISTLLTLSTSTDFCKSFLIKETAGPTSFPLSIRTQYPASTLGKANTIRVKSVDLVSSELKPNLVTWYTDLFIADTVDLQVSLSSSCLTYSHDCCSDHTFHFTFSTDAGSDHSHFSASNLPIPLWQSPFLIKVFFWEFFQTCNKRCFLYDPLASGCHCIINVNFPAFWHEGI